MDLSSLEIFRCVAEEPNRAFGREDLVSETWELDL